MDAVHELDFVEVDEQTDGYVEQFHVAQQLRLMDGQHLLNALQFQEQAILNQYIETQRFVENKALVLDLNNTLVYRSQALHSQFPEQAFLIDAFNEARPFQAVHFNCRTDDNTAQFIRLLEQGMHSGFLQKATKETKRKNVLNPSFSSFASVKIPVFHGERMR